MSPRWGVFDENVCLAQGVGMEQAPSARGLLKDIPNEAESHWHFPLEPFFIPTRAGLRVWITESIRLENARGGWCFCSGSFQCFLYVVQALTELKTFLRNSDTSCFSQRKLLNGVKCRLGRFGSGRIETGTRQRKQAGRGEPSAARNQCASLWKHCPPTSVGKHRPYLKTTSWEQTFYCGNSVGKVVTRRSSTNLSQERN